MEVIISPWMVGSLDWPCQGIIAYVASQLTPFEASMLPFQKTITLSIILRHPALVMLLSTTGAHWRWRIAVSGRVRDSD